MLALGPIARRAFIAVFVGVQLGLVLTADRRADRIFGFRMFNESSSLKFDLYRKLSSSERVVPVRAGSWEVVTASGTRTFRWTDRVRYAALGRPGIFRHATYGAEAQLFRLQAALDDAMAHLQDDPETLELIAEVETIRNGRAGPRLRLTGVRP